MEAVLNAMAVRLRTHFGQPAVAALQRLLRSRPAVAMPSDAIAGRTLMLVFAIMSFLACLTIGAVSLMTRTAASWQTAVSSEITIQVRPVDGVPLDAEAEKAAEAARATPGIARASVINAEDGAALLRPWLGDGLDLSMLPVPRLVVLEIAPDAAPDLEDLRRRLSAVRGASLDDHRLWRNRLSVMADTLIFLGIFVLLLVLGATGLIVIFATRAAMAGNREIIEVLSLIGARRSFIAREIERRFFAIGLKGAGAGACAALLTFLAVRLVFGSGGDPAADQVEALFGVFRIGPLGWLGAFATILFVAGLTAGVSRLAVLQALRETR